MLKPILPDTDEKILSLLNCLTEYKERVVSVEDLPIAFDVLGRASGILSDFSNKVELHRQAMEMWHDNNTQFKQAFSKLQMYVTHFFQVYLFAVERGDFKEDTISYYGLQDKVMPDISTTDELEKRCKMLIEGERERVANRGVSMTNPTVAQVSIAFDNYKEALFNKQVKDNYIHHTKSKLGESRQQTLSFLETVMKSIQEKIQNMPKEQQVDILTDLWLDFVNEFSKNEDRNTNGCSDLSQDVVNYEDSDKPNGDLIDIKDEVTTAKYTIPLQSEFPFF